MMTPDEVIDLLSLAAGFDQRTVGHDDVRAWGLIANEDDWTLPLACRALVEHAKIDPMPARPAHIKAIIDGVRKKIRAQFTEDVCPPRELADDPRAEIEWRRKRVADYTQRALDCWAVDGQIPELDQRVALGETLRPELSAEVKRFAELCRPPVKREKHPERGSDARAAQRAEALAALDEKRADLDALRAAATDESDP